MQIRGLRLYAFAVSLVLFSAATARAQYKPRPVNDPATGESYHIEASAGWWFSNADLTVTSSGSGALTGLVGTSINGQTDLGMPADNRFPNLSLVLRPARSHKFRLNFVPLSFDGAKTVTRDIDFNGQRYHIGLPVTSTLSWKAARFSYEYDFITRNTWYVGFILEAKYTDLSVNLTTPGPPAIAEFDQARAPIPALGFVGRAYVVPNISITGEVTAFKIPTIQDKYSGHYVDVDVYGTINLIEYFGVQAGYRSMDFGFLAKTDSASFVVKGPYVGVVVRY
ncbi:MAG TPA: hypothetical protein VIW45_05460 [Vicinamibacterales bacterium]|jgi:hypothetical protein